LHVGVQGCLPTHMTIRIEVTSER